MIILLTGINWILNRGGFSQNSLHLFENRFSAKAENLFSCSFG